MKLWIEEYGLDTSHFLGKSSNLGKASTRKQPASAILTIRSDQRRPQGARLKRALLELGVPHVCAGCGLAPEWRGKTLTLQVDHIDGNWRDSRRENLRFMCPNCHSQESTSTSCPPKVRGQCKVCGDLHTKKGSGTCSKECSTRLRRGVSATKIQWPSDETLRELVQKLPYEEIGRQLGVSGAAVKKRCKSRGLPLGPGLGYWQKIKPTKLI